MDIDNNKKKNSQAKIKANNKYTKLHYTRFNVAVKPAIAEDIKQAAAAEGLSIAAYFVKVHNLYKADRGLPASAEVGEGQGMNGQVAEGCTVEE